MSLPSMPDILSHAPIDHRHHWLDRLGMSAGMLCAVHCLALPIVVALLPVAGLDFLLGDGVETSFVFLAVILGALSLVPGYLRVHRRLLPLFFLLLGASLLAAGRTLVAEGSRGETSVVLVGALAVVLAHASNARFCSACRSCEGAK